MREYKDASERRKARRKKKAARKGNVALLIIVLVVLAGALYIMFGSAPGNGGGAETQGTEEPDEAGVQEKPKPPAGSDGPDVAGDPGADDEDQGEDIEGQGGADPLWYYNIDRAERYEAFAARMPGLSHEDAVWMVEADLDREPYENVNEVPDPNSLTLLVNKHFYLPESFSPADLVGIGNSMMRKEAADAMLSMIDEAAAEGHKLWVQSGFRSFSTQVSLYSQYSARDGSEVADTYSARAGHSEHQSGMAADFNTITDAFGDTPEGRWASENAWRYGFIERYTAENTDVTLYKREPWHFRYIGRVATIEMHSLGFSSYEEYWVKYVKYSPPQGG